MPEIDISFTNDSEDLTRHTENDDLIAGMKSARVWGTLGWNDIRQRYRCSVLGPFWFTARRHAGFREISGYSGA